MAVDNLSGQTFGQYQLRDQLGAGGMGSVYRAYQSSLKREVAVKVLTRSLASQPGYIERFSREAEIAASLEHAHIVPVYDYGIQGDISYVVMRMLTGGSLAQRLNQCLIEGRPLPSISETADLLRQVAGAMDYAHSRGVIHRDIKPGNIMFDNHGLAYLVDFGIAKLVNASTMLTLTNSVSIGTPTYMPPEQWRGDELTPATDQYALAVTLYTMLTGRLPFEAETPYAIMHKHLYVEPTPPRTWREDISFELEDVFTRALSKDPTSRFDTITEFSTAFQDGMGRAASGATGFFHFGVKPEAPPPRPTGGSTGGRPPVTPRPATATPPPRGRGRGLPLILIVGLLALIVAVGVIFLTTQQTDDDGRNGGGLVIITRVTGTAVAIAATDAAPDETEPATPVALLPATDEPTASEVAVEPSQTPTERATETDIPPTATDTDAPSTATDIPTQAATTTAEPTTDTDNDADTLNLLASPTDEPPTATHTDKPATATDTPTSTATPTERPTATDTATPTDTPTPIPTATETPTRTPIPGPTLVVRQTRVIAQAATETQTATPSPTEAPSLTSTDRPTATETAQPSPTHTLTPTATPSATNTPQPTATETPAPTQTPTPSDTPTATRTPTLTSVPTATDTPEPTATPSETPEPSNTPTPDLWLTVTALYGDWVTKTAEAQLTLTVAATGTPDLQSTVSFMLTEYATTVATLTARAQMTTPSPTPTAEHPYLSPVQQNADWTWVTRAIDGAEMVLVPPGCFTMGSTEAEIDTAFQQCEANMGAGQCQREWFEKEGPAAEICFGEPFWIDQTEVTNIAYGSTSTAFGRGGLYPREMVSWAEAAAYCAERGGRLPTEAEWEYAASGPDDLVYPWGNSFVADNSTYLNNSGGRPSPVAIRPQGASWVGAYDMSGNIREWTSSLFMPYPYRATDGRENPNNTTDPRAVRGGSWFVIPVSLRTADRTSVHADIEDWNIGFRCVHDFTLADLDEN
jgi:serine/threonine-protein kinase